MTLKPEDPRPSPVGREEVARVVASALGDDFDHAFVNKSEWNKARGEKGGRYRDINEPMQDDYLATADAILALFSPADGWRPIETAPKDGTYILSQVGVIDSERFAHWSGRTFVIRHEGVRESGFDLGWSMFPGFGGAPDHWFAGWQPLPAAPPPPGGQG